MDSHGPAVDELRRTADAAREAVARLREGLGSGQADRRARVDGLGAEFGQLLDRLTDEIAAELSARHADAEAARREELDAARAALDDERRAWEEQRVEWEGVRTQVEAELAAIESRLIAEAQALREARRAEADSGDLLARIEEAVATQRVTAERLAASEALVESLTAAVAAAEAERDDHATLREKFELAIADLQSHREHVAALEEELAHRPPGDDGAIDADQWRQLAEERDDLARRLDEALHTPGQPDDELAELRERFEAAVEDVRRLKNENQQLRERGVDAPSADPLGDGLQGWEAQKRRLLAALESEGEPDGPERREERASIAGTIQITDAVVADKDAEIERLRAALEEAGSHAAADAAVESLLDGDGLVRAERERLAKLEQELSEKVRATELELSVERAKGARAQAQLAEQEVELETLRAARGSGPTGEARRNWLNKLGLGNEGG